MSDELESAVPDDVLTETKPAVVVVLEEDKKQESDGALTKKEPKVIDAAEEGVEALAKNLNESKKKEETERVNRIAAERRATAAEIRASTAETKISAQTQQNIEANRTAATNAKAAAQAELAKAEDDFVSLQAEGKFKEAYAATLRGAKAQQQMEHANGYLNQLEQTVENLKNAPPVAEKPQSDSKGTVDPVTGIKFTPKTYDWVAAQGDKWKDQDFRVECDAASRIAKRKGLSPDTPEYFEFLESRLEQSGFIDASEEGEAVEQKPKTVIRKAAGANAGPAPTRAVAGSSGVAKKGVKLSSAEREVAQAIVDSLPDHFNGVNPDQLYAKNKQELINEFGEDYGKQTKQ